MITTFLLVSKGCYDWGRRNVFSKNFIFLWFKILQRARDNTVAGLGLDHPNLNIVLFPVGAPKINWHNKLSLKRGLFRS